MNTYFSRLFAYHDWANQQYFPILRLEGVPEEVIRLYSHILNAHGIWMARILSQKMPVDGWEVHSPAELPEIHARFQEQSVRLIEIENNFDREIAYQNSRGERFNSSVGDILAHIVNHGSYHRGQVAWLLRQAGITPVATDYIFYRRQL